MASDRGYLWPTPEQEFLLRACLLEGESAIRAYRQWAARVDLEALDQGSFRMLPLVYRNLYRLGVETPLLDKYKGAYRQTHYQNKLAFHRIAALLKSLDQAGIDTLVLKGAAMIALFYGEAGLRPIADFDLLVRPQQALAAIDLLQRSGWQRRPGLPLTEGYISVHYSWAFSLPGAAELDLHWYAFDQCCYPGADEELWKSAVPVNIAGFPARAPNATDQLLHACVHGAEWNSVPPVRWIADAITILRGAEIDWQRLVGQAKQRRLIPATYETLAYLRRKFGAPIPDAVLDELRNTPVRFMDRVEYGSRTSAPGNFPSLRKISFGYLRHRARSAESGSQPLSFFRYLQARWGASNLWEVFRTGARLVAASAQNRFSPAAVSMTHEVPPQARSLLRGDAKSSQPIP